MACSVCVELALGVPLGCVFGPLLFLLYVSEVTSILGNDLNGFANDSTLIIVVQILCARISVAQSLDRDLVKNSD